VGLVAARRLTGALLLACLCRAAPVAAQEPAPAPLVVLVLPEDVLERLLPPPAPAPPADSLTIPTTLYVASIGAEWLTGSIRCAIPCATWT
jgi:hypothetical protein